MTKAVFLPLGLIFLLTAAVSSSGQTDANPADPAVQEAILRQANTIVLRQKLVAARIAEQRGELVNAAKLYEECAKLAVTIGSGIDLETQQALAGLAHTRLALARESMSRQEYGEADKQIVQVLKYDPKNPDALALKRKNEELIAASQGKLPTQDTIAQIPVVRDQKIQASTLVQDGKLLYEMGKLEAAEAKLKQAAAIDPDNTAASYYLNLIQQAQFNRSAAAHVVDSQTRMQQVEKQWVLPHEETLQTPNPFAETNLVYTGSGRQNIMNKLNRITLDNVSYDSLPLSEVIRDLSEKAKTRDPEKIGVNFLINPNSDKSDDLRALGAPGAQGGFGGGFGGAGAGRAAAVDPATGLPANQEATAAEAVDPGASIVKLNLSNVRLLDVLNAITLVADHPIKYTIEDFAIVFSSKSPNSVPLFARTFKVDANTFFQGLESVSSTSFGGSSSSSGGSSGGSSSSGGQTQGGSVVPVVDFAPGAGQIRSSQNSGSGGGGGGSQNQQSFGNTTAGGGGAVSAGGVGGAASGWGGSQSAQGGVNFLTIKRTTGQMNIFVRNFFNDMGVNLNPPRSVFFNDRLGQLFVRATEDDLDVIERAIETLNQLPPQVHIKARFIEIDQSDSKGLGFDWSLGQFGGSVVAQGGQAGSLNVPVTQSAPLGIFPGPNAANAIAAGGQSITSGLSANNSTIPTVGTITGILTNPNFQVAIHALESRTGSEDLGEPEVTTVSGRQTQIRATTLQSIVQSVGFGGGTGGVSTGTTTGGTTP